METAPTYICTNLLLDSGRQMIGAAMLMSSNSTKGCWLVGCCSCCCWCSRGCFLLGAAAGDGLEAWADAIARLGWVVGAACRVLGFRGG
eukprot:scaffold169548_cov19-Tisochrysis_lutea.AAC.1